jgi:lactoylglutathione lyase
MTNFESLKIETCGIILGTENFDACARFYRDIIGLPVWYVKSKLVCLRFGDGYLMIETGGKASSQIKLNNESPTMLRFNVEDVRAAAKQLTERGVTVKIAEYDWGTVGTFTDPDGNKCELKNADDPFFS